MDDSLLWDKLIRLAEAVPEPCPLTLSPPTVFGERHQPAVSACVSGISPSNASLGALFKAASYGIVDNVFRMVPVDLLLAHRVSRIIATGSVFAHNPLVLRRLGAVLPEGVGIVHAMSRGPQHGAAEVALTCCVDSSRPIGMWEMCDKVYKCIDINRRHH